jgi:hypothetical protein
MAKFIVTQVNRYEVEGASLREVINNFHIIIEGVEPEMFGLTTATLTADDFVYLDGTVNAEESE